MKTLIVVAAAAMGFAAPCEAGELTGPGRFCGYSPVIDLLPGEKVTTLQSGIHAGSFRWDGAFGSLKVDGIGWASRPTGPIVEAQAEARPARFAERQADGRYVVAIWNGANAAAYFSSEAPLTPDQIEAIGRVTLFEEGETPSACNLRTLFVQE
jgi:hypothetical protein